MEEMPTSVSVPLENGKVIASLSANNVAANRLTAWVGDYIARFVTA